MPIKIGANFAYNGKLANFERDKFVTKAAMKAFDENSIDEGHLSYCEEDGNIYQYKSANAADATTGKWRIFKADVDLSAYATKDSVATDLDKKVDVRGLQNKFVKAAPYLVRIATITIPHIANITGTIDINIQSRHFVFNLNARISYTTDFAKLDVQIFDNSVNATDNKLYYYIDTTNSIDKLLLYYYALPYDVVTAKVTNLSGTLKLDCSIECEELDYEALPDGAIQINNINYGNKNLFYATPKDAAGDPKFRAIDITDLPDLSSKYATKDKAFTKDTVSTEPGQFVAGPATTQGNLYLRKIDASDIPDLKSKYQKLDSNGYQEKAKAAGLIVKHGNTGDTGSGYLIAEIDQAVGGQMGPDWYYATDGSLQDITASYYKKAYLDDKFKVISASLNDLASKTYDDTEVRQLISNNTSAIGTKADKSELSKYQPIYRADYVANKDIDYSELPADATSVDLNGYTLSVTGVVTISNRQFYNGIVKLSVDGVVSKNNHYNNVDIYTYPTFVYTYNENGSNYWNCRIQKANIIAGTTLEYCEVRDSVLASVLANCYFTGFVRCTFNTNGLVGHAVTVDDKLYLQCVIKDSNPTEADFESDIDKPVIQGNAPSCDAVNNKFTTINSSITDVRTSLESTQTDFVDLRNKVNAMPKTEFVTQEKYDADKEANLLDANTIYYIKG